MTKIWFLGPGSGSGAQKCHKNLKIILIKCENNVKVWKSQYFHVFSYYVHINFHIFGPGTRAQALKRWRARPGPGPVPPLWGPGPGPGPQNVEIIWNNITKYEKNVISQFHSIFTFYSYYFHIFITFLTSGPRSTPQKSYFCHIPGHILFIFFSYFGICLGWAPCPYCNLWNN